MTGVIVFTGPASDQIVADTLLTGLADPAVPAKLPTISTGVVQDSDGTTKYAFDEGFLKIGVIQPNLAVGLSGKVSTCNEILRALRDRSNEQQFSEIDDIRGFLIDQLFPSLLPSKVPFSVCGLIASSTSPSVKFVARFSNVTNVTFECSSEDDAYYCIGAGAEVLRSAWEARNKDHLEYHANPGSEFWIFAEELYKRQFFDGQIFLTTTFTGGTITGVYSLDGQIHWHPPTTILAYMNVGGTGLDALWEHLPRFYKVWEQDGSVFTKTILEENIVEKVDHYGDGTRVSVFTRLLFVRHSNCLSLPRNFEDYRDDPEFRSFNSHIIAYLLQPKGMASESARITVGDWDRPKPFLEFEDDGQHGFRLNSGVQQLLLGECFVTADGKILLGIDAAEPLRAEILKALGKVGENWARSAELHCMLSFPVRKIAIRDQDFYRMAEALHHAFVALELCEEHHLNNLPGLKGVIDWMLDDLREHADPLFLEDTLLQVKDKLAWYEKLKR